MGRSKKEPISIEEVANNLATYAINRDELKQMIEAIPQDNDLNMATLEYELQILRILSVGWAISFYMPQSPEKKSLSLVFWENIKEISTNISTIMESTTGQAIDYFTILKERLDVYVKAMQENQEDVSEPTSIMGPAFAGACGIPDNAIAILIGTKMFTFCLGGVKEYLESLEITTAS
ncbi:MAG: hypothetical protein GY737_17740 [Desulfobacteraceae bacterium]|nr:hypothetical protein [Desulfobacteraceae bacterium]